MMPRCRQYVHVILFLLGVLFITTFFHLLLNPLIAPEQLTIPFNHVQNFSTHSFPRVRQTPDKRRFNSSAVEALIKEIHQNIKNPELTWLFENCFPNTLDTTVDFNPNTGADNHPDTYVITGDIDAMWLRDSSAQIHPYLPLMKYDSNLRLLIEGVILRQLICVQRDPYANAFYKDLERISEWKHVDNTEMRDGIHERKWALDSLCYVLRLMYSYWKEVNYDSTLFLKHKEEFQKTIRIILETFKVQRRYNGTGPYTFQRENAPVDPRGNTARPNGLIYSYFRPSDDIQEYPYLIPSQFFAYHTLKHLSHLIKSLNWTNEFDFDINTITNDLHKKLFNEKNLYDLDKSIMMKHSIYGLIYAYEINGLGNQHWMDDAPIPSLLSLPYLCPTEFSLNDTIYQNTRKFLLDKQNPWYFSGRVLEGIGRSHVEYGTVWPLAVIMRGLTSDDDEEIRSCLNILQRSHGETGYMHESIHVDDSTQFTRAWFAWANSLFGEFIWKVYREKPYLLNKVESKRL
ncbi:hypothetical protein I4U23_026768 [Adineta vaga]|nr:hypothetical protein I4U23_026768 [Adineta vaga]